MVTYSPIEWGMITVDNAHYVDWQHPNPLFDHLTLHLCLARSDNLILAELYREKIKKKKTKINGMIFFLPSLFSDYNTPKSQLAQRAKSSMKRVNISNALNKVL